MTRIREQKELVFVGIDCATNARKVGLARGFLADGRPRIDRLGTGTTWAAIDDQVAGWIADRTLIALDAPVGWPVTLGETLPTHQAGAAMPAEANALFRRSTDDVVAAKVGKRPLDVGADRIARTAHAAISFLERLRRRTGREIPLAWAPGTVEGASAIEVYPAGTLAGRRLLQLGYKGAKVEAVSVRRSIIASLAKEVAFESETSEAMATIDHLLDAALCVLAGFDFATGDVIIPSDLELAECEGWIWVKPKR